MGEGEALAGGVAEDDPLGVGLADADPDAVADADGDGETVAAEAESLGVAPVLVGYHVGLTFGAAAVASVYGGIVVLRVGAARTTQISMVSSVIGLGLLALPHVGFATTIVLAFVIGLVMSSSFSAILVYAQDLLPGRVGLVAGVFFGFSFGLGGIGAAALGELADRTSLDTVYAICAFLPAIGLLTVFLPRQAGQR